MIERRKGEQYDLAVAEAFAAGNAGWDDIELVHDALPAVDASEIDVTGTLMGRSLRLPLVIAGMTGGHARALDVNRALAVAAEELGIAIGVGSQRAALRDPALEPTYAVIRAEAPTAFIIGNIGISQLIDQAREPALTRREIERALAMVKADALAIHLNFLEESVQPEGQTRARGIAAALQELARWSPVPIIAKETGAGISRSVAERLRDLGIAGIDVGGLGGTSFAAIEARRAEAAGDTARAGLGKRFATWGVPTSVSVLAVAGCGIETIATGGVRSGFEAAKALALGAAVVGVGRPLLLAATEGPASITRWVKQFELELRTATFLSGTARARDLRQVRRVIRGATRDWIDQLSY